MTRNSRKARGAAVARDLVARVESGARNLSRMAPPVRPQKVKLAARDCCKAVSAACKCLVGLVKPGCQCYCCIIGILIAIIGIMWLVIKYYQWRLGDDHLAVLLRTAG